MNQMRWAIGLYFLVMSQVYALDIYAHRGAAGLAPENTLEAYRTALDLGVDVLDLDVGLTSDNVVVVYHDIRLNPNITRHLNGQWLEQEGPALSDLTYQELLGFDVGKINPQSDYQRQFPLQLSFEKTHIPTLQEVIRYAKSRAPSIRFQIEIKTNPFDKASPHPDVFVPLITKVLKEEQVESQTEVHSFDWRNLALLEKIAPDVSRSYITYDETHLNKEGLVWTGGATLNEIQDNFPKLVHALHAHVWCPYFKEANEKDITEAHRLGLRVTVWSVDEPEDMNRMIDLGVDGIITNRPDILRGLLAARNLLPHAVSHHQT